YEGARKADTSTPLFYRIRPALTANPETGYALRQFWPLCRAKEPFAVISVIFCSRVKDNPDSNFGRLLDSIVATTSPGERRQIEVLIKFDSDDDCRPQEGFFSQYPFAIKTFTWSR